MFNNFKIIIIVLIFQMLIANCYCQETEYSFQYISNAYQYFEKNKLDKALYELEIAEKSDYGFCGNAWSEAEWSIKYLRAQIFMKQNLFDKSLLEIDKIKGCGFGGNCQKSDSLKVVILIKKFGLQKVSNSFKENKTYVRGGSFVFDNCCIRLSDLNYNFCFTLFKKFQTNKKLQLDLMKTNISFCDYIKDFNFYKLLE